MKFTTPKKTLAESLKLVTQLAAVVVGKDAVDKIDVVADEGGVRVCLQHGSLTFEQRLAGAAVVVPGSMTVSLKEMEAPLAISGERLTLKCTGQKLAYEGARAKGYTSTFGPVKDTITWDTEDLVSLSFFPALLAAVSLKKGDKDSKTDLAVRFETPTTVRLETLDQSRIIYAQATTDVWADTTAVVSTAILDVLRKHLDQAKVKADGASFAIHTPTLKVRFPQESEKVQDAKTALADARVAESNLPLGAFSVKMSEIGAAIKDAQAVSREGRNVEMALLGNRLTIGSSAGSNNIESGCDLMENEILTGECRWAMSPVLLASTLEAFKDAEAIRVAVHSGALIVERMECVGDVRENAALVSMDTDAIIDTSVEVPPMPAKKAAPTKAPPAPAPEAPAAPAAPAAASPKATTKAAAAAAPTKKNKVFASLPQKGEDEDTFDEE